MTDEQKAEKIADKAVDAYWKFRALYDKVWELDELVGERLQEQTYEGDGQ